ncbi:MAG TPA: LuxR C-terminal-related transcriptional regulator, partial [Thermoleophilaceae bacterium]
GDPDLLALSLHQHGRFLVRLGRVEPGLALLDEAMVAVMAGELSPIVTGLLYCSVIDGCQEAYALRRAREWTAALSRWCREQPDLVSFTGRCMVHRAEIMQLHGEWEEALEEARRARERFEREASQSATGQAHYRQGELHRLRGDFHAAENEYREASRHGWEPQPGLAMLRLAQGRTSSAAAAIRRVAGEASEQVPPPVLLPAYVEIMLAAGETHEARRASDELAALAGAYEPGMLDPLVDHARGAVELAEGDAAAAVSSLRRSCRLWQELGAPYDAARARVLVGLACRALGDEDAASLELDAARGAFAELGAEPDLARLDSLTPAGDSHGLTPRELEVLRLVAAGETNKAIAARLVLSERTVDRHVSNIFAKLRLSSRAAATAYAYEHELI